MKRSAPALLLLLLGLALEAPAAEGTPPPGYTLEQLHLLFRHGNRTPEAPYHGDPNKDYAWPPYGYFHLSKAGIESSHRLGMLLRRMYNSFLGDTYRISDVNATSTDVARTKLTLQAVMAGMYPPKGDQQWDAPGSLGALWQPFVYHYTPEYRDDVFLMKTPDCPRYNKEWALALRSETVQQMINSDAEMVRALQERGLDTTLHGMARLHSTVTIEAYAGLPVPDWLQPFCPERLEKMARIYFQSQVLTRSMQRLRIGPLVKQMVTTMKETRSGAAKARVWLYSGHDDTLGAVAATIRTPLTAFPDFNALLVLELLKDVDTGEYAVQVLHRESHAVDAHVVPVEGCNANPCPLDKFNELLQDVMPQDWRKECQLGEEKKRPLLSKPGAVGNGTIPAKSRV